MKFVVVVVLFALALGAHSSVVPLAVSTVHGTVVGVPAGAVHAVHVAGLPHIVAASPVQIVSSPLVAAHPAVVAVAPVEGSYVAQTRGAVHIAPLPGHANSAASVNLEPAPGTV